MGGDLCKSRSVAKEELLARETDVERSMLRCFQACSIKIARRRLASTNSNRCGNLLPNGKRSFVDSIKIKVVRSIGMNLSKP